MLSELSAYIDSMETYSDLIISVENVLEKPISSQLVQDILMLKETFNFSNERVIEFVQFLKEKSKYSHNYIEKVAHTWIDNNIFTLKDFKESQNSFTASIPPELHQLFALLGLSIDRITKSDFDIYESWQQRNFDYSLIKEACERTKEKATVPTLNYADKILSRWSEEQIYSVDELKTREMHREVNAAKIVNVKSHNFEERKYDYSELMQELGISQ